MLASDFLDQLLAGGDPAGGLLVQLEEGGFGGVIDGHKHVQSPLFDTNLGNGDVKVAERVALGLALSGHVALVLRQLRDAAALEAAVH
jgi:hypothetical protein